MSFCIPERRLTNIMTHSGLAHLAPFEKNVFIFFLAVLLKHAMWCSSRRRFGYKWVYWLSVSGNLNLITTHPKSQMSRSCFSCTKPKIPIDLLSSIALVVFCSDVSNMLTLMLCFNNDNQTALHASHDTSTDWERCPKSCWCSSFRCSRFSSVSLRKEQTNQLPQMSD